MAEPTYELYDGDPDSGGTKVGELAYDLANNQVVIRDEPSGEEARLDSSGLDVSTLISDLHEVTSVSEPPNPSSGTSRLWSQDDQGRSLLRHKGSGGVIQRLSGDSDLLVKNSTASTLSQYSVVYNSGVDANGVMTVDLAASMRRNDKGSDPTFPAVGILLEDITSGGYGLMRQIGVVQGLDTSSWIDREILYLESSPAGTFTTTSGNELVIIQRLAQVIESSTSGSIWFNPEWPRGVSRWEYVDYSPGVIRFADGLSGAQIHRFKMHSNEHFIVTKMSLLSPTGMTSTDVSLELFSDDLLGLLSPSVNLGESVEKNTWGGITTSPDVWVEFSNSSGAPVDVSPVVRGVLYEYPETNTLWDT